MNENLAKLLFSALRQILHNQTVLLDARYTEINEDSPDHIDRVIIQDVMKDTEKVLNAIESIINE